jgi:membrane fusion protein, multidrug efflux system
LAIFGFAFYLVLRKHEETAKRVPRGGGGPTTVVTATAQQGDIGVYLEAIGTVTPVYTASITSQVNGIVTAVHYKEGQIVHKGDPLIDIDSRSYRATLLQAQGTLERDENILAMAKMDVDRYREAWARRAIPKQTLDDQEKVVLQDQGTVKIDEGTVQFDQVQVEYCHITSPIDGKVGLRLGASRASQKQKAERRSVRPRGTNKSSDRNAAHAGQPNRHHDWHREGARIFC